MTDRQAAGPRFGVNYVPSRNWWHCWLDWDPDSILADLRAVAGLGLDHAGHLVAYRLRLRGEGWLTDAAPQLPHLVPYPILLPVDVAVYPVPVLNHRDHGAAGDFLKQRSLRHSAPGRAVPIRSAGRRLAPR
ncbi:hypothetical protein [Micromonospora lupini]|uniref:hypothetical protein n=1 Tax=Micromonospora lupini TaxID=285679 RepID=UPI0033C11437